MHSRVQRMCRNSSSHVRAQYAPVVFAHMHTHQPNIPTRTHTHSLSNMCFYVAHTAEKGFYPQTNTHMHTYKYSNTSASVCLYVCVCLAHTKWKFHIWCFPTSSARRVGRVMHQPTPSSSTPLSWSPVHKHKLNSIRIQRCIIRNFSLLNVSGSKNTYFTKLSSCIYQKLYTKMLLQLCDIFTENNL